LKKENIYHTVNKVSGIRKLWSLCYHAAASAWGHV